MIESYFPDGSDLSPEETQTIIEATRKGMLQVIPGELRYSQPVLVGRHPGVEFAVSMQSGESYKARIFATDLALFQVMVQVPRIRLDSEDVAWFIHSFTPLVRDKPAVEKPEP